MNPPSHNTILNMPTDSENISYNYNVQTIQNNHNMYNLNNIYTRVRSKRDFYSRFISVSLFSQIPHVYKRDLQLFARELGISLEKHPHLIKYIIAAIIEPLPLNWSENIDSNGNIYYSNNTINETSWTHPCDNYYKDIMYSKITIKKNCLFMFRKVNPLS
tara:strand:+ start:1337 stop:1816 length:480 start_codon:yes stop_codon:yes gene_type:complete